MWIDFLGGRGSCRAANVPTRGQARTDGQIAGIGQDFPNGARLGNWTSSGGSAGASPSRFSAMVDLNLDLAAFTPLQNTVGPLLFASVPGSGLNEWIVLSHGKVVRRAD